MGIGEGAYADVHTWAPGQVLKLFKAGFSWRHSWWEARMTLAVFATGAPAPEVPTKCPWRGASASCCSASTDRPSYSSRGAAP